MAAAACTVAPEEALLHQFFAASRLRDKTALGAFATTIFEPHVDGIVTEFEILDISRGPSPGDGQSAVEEVTIRAPVRLPDGTTRQRTLIVRLEPRPGDRRAGDWEWIVTGVRYSGSTGSRGSRTLEPLNP